MSLGRWATNKYDGSSSSSSSSSSAFPAISLGFTIFGEIFAYVTGFLLLLLFSNHRGSHILSSWIGT